MDENKSSTPESTPEENNINPAQPEANTAGPGEGKNKRSLRNTILTCISIALVLFAAIIVLRQYVYLPGKYEGFDDVSDGYWAAEYIKDAAIHGWVEGYGDGTFRADDPIDRAEVVTIVNRLLGREADEDYIADNHRRLVMFPDVSSRHWAYYNVLEAANAHTANLTNPETWEK